MGEMVIKMTSISGILILETENFTFFLLCFISYQVSADSMSLEHIIVEILI